MARKKLSFGEAGIKGFLGRHVEKILLGLVGITSALIIWSGFNNRQGIDPNKTPENLRQEVTRATTHVDGFKWDDHFHDKRNPQDRADLTARAAESLEKMKEDSYVMGTHLTPPVSTPRTKRTDPDLLVATDLLARPGYGALVKSNTFRERPTDQGEGEQSILQQAEDEEELPEFDPKIFRPVPQGFGRTTGEGMRGGMARSSEAGKGVYFVSVTGLVPFRQQLQIYQTSFLNASSFSPGRDVPRYVGWVLEKSPVVEGSDKRQWKRITLKTAKNMEQKLGIRGRGMEGGGGSRDMVIDPQAHDAELTRPGPPLIARDFDRLCRHHGIAPFEEAIRRQRAEANEDEATEEDEPEEEDDLGIEADPRMMGGGERGFGGERGGYPRGEMGGEFAREMGPMREGGGEMSRFGGERQFGGQGGDVAGNIDPSEAPEYKMFRFIDLDVEAGKSYVYRLKLVLEDPNFPAIEQAEPPESSLEGSVIQRRKKLKSAARPDKRGRWYRVTDASDESNVVRIMQGQRILASAVSPARATVPRDGGLAFWRTGEEPTGKAMALRFDIERAADIPGKFDVRRGTVANFKLKETEALIPAYNMLEKMEDVEFRLNSMVLDLRGGDKHKFDELQAPGEMLVLDARGRLVVVDELSDADDYESNIFPKQETNQRGNEFGRPGGERGFEGEGGRPNFREGGRR